MKKRTLKEAEETFLAYEERHLKATTDREAFFLLELMGVARQEIVRLQAEGSA
jgi:hypothetical protein